MPEDNDHVQIQDEGPSRRNFLKVSAVAGATVAALAAGAGMLPKLASSAATSAGTSATSSSAKAEVVSVSKGEPLILVLNGESVDVYQGQTKFPLKDSSFAREIAAHVNERIR
jgi:hypothetical protein